jgi:hypothetical protein
MRKIIVTLTLLLATLVSHEANAAAAFVTAWCHENGATTTTTVAVTLNASGLCSGQTPATPASSATVGDALVVYVGINGAGVASTNVSTFTDNASPANTYTTISNTPSSICALSGGQYYCWAVFLLCNITHAPTTITATVTASQQFHSIVAVELSGIATTSCLDGGSTPDAIKIQNSLAAGTNAINSGNLVTSASGDYIIGGTVNVSGSGTMTAGTSPLTYTSRFSVASLFQVEDGTQASAGTLTNGATGTNSATDYFVTSAIALVPAAGGGGATCGARELLGVGC